MQIIPLLLYTCGGFALLTSLHHFFISFNGLDRKVHLNFAIASLPLILYVNAMVIIYTAVSADQIIFATKIQMFCIPIFFIFFSRFASYLCNKKPGKFLNIISLVIIVVPLLRMFSPGLLVYSNIRGVREVTLFWGEKISLIDADTTLFASCYYLLILVFVGYLLKMSIGSMKGSNYQNGKALLVSVVIFIFAAINDILIDVLNIPWLYLGEYSFILIMLVMSYYMSIDVYRASLLQSKIDEGEKLLNAIMGNASAVISIKDFAGRYLMINGEFERVFKLDRNSVIGRSDYELFKQKIADSFTINDNEIKRQKCTMQFEEAIPHQDGPHIFVVNKFPITDKDGEVYAIGSIATDITDKRNLESRLRQSEKMQAVGQLAGGVAHDFNNQLAGIIGYADMIKEKSEENSSIREYVKYILTAAKRSSELTGQLLAFARKGKYQSAVVDIHNIIDETLTLLKRSINKKIVLKKELDAEIPFVIGDSTQLQNVILNLAVNSCDAIDTSGEIKISTCSIMLDEHFCSRSSYTIKPGEYIQISVKDNGNGIPKDIQNRIFEPFFTTKEPGKGTGMGLSAAYGTIKNHHGAIVLISDENNGTEIKLYLPITKEKFKSIVDNGENEEVVKGSGIVMVIDDEEVLRRMTSMMLPSLGYEVKDFEDGVKAVEYFRENYMNIDLVIVDLIMPKMDGKDVFKALMQIDPNVKVLISSGFSLDGDAQEMINNGAKGFIQKPYKKIALAKKISEILNN